MYRRRKGRPGRWIAVLLIICGLGGIYWMTKTGPSSLQADGDPTNMITLDGGSNSNSDAAPAQAPSFANEQENTANIGDVVMNETVTPTEPTPTESVMRTEERADCLLYTSPSPRDKRQSRMPSSA